MGARPPCRALPSLAPSFKDPPARRTTTSQSFGEVNGMKKISVRKTDSIKLTTIVIGGSYASC
jgi:hypothetical protein